MVGYARVAHSTEKDCVEWTELFQPVFGHHALGLEECFATPVEVIESSGKTKAPARRFEHAYAFGDDFLPDAVSWNRGDFVSSYRCCMGRWRIHSEELVSP